MNEAEKARAYLKGALAELGVTLKDASATVRRNPAYIQQYLERGKPAWLDELARRRLVDRYGLDETKLAPTFLAESGPRREKAGIDAQRDARRVEEALKDHLMGFWPCLSLDLKWAIVILVAAAATSDVAGSELPERPQSGR